MSQPLWQPRPEQVRQTNLAAFMSSLQESKGLDFTDYAALYDWSISDVEAFWEAVWDYGQVIAEGSREPVLVDGDKMPGAAFYPNVRLNFAENLLRRRDGHDAIVFWGEDKVKRRLSHEELYDLVSRTAQALQSLGVGEGDRVAGFMPNMPETVIAMLATTSLGAIWSSCSPDFGTQGVLDRFGQIEPKVIFCPDGYYYNGKTISSLERVAAFSKDLPSVRKIVVAPYLAEAVDLKSLDDRALTFQEFIEDFPAKDIEFNRVAFNSPLYIMYSSGTTGKPKCIVHGVGGTLIQHLKEHKLQCDVRRDDRVFYYTTCGWMMWNWLITALASEATLLLYDGSPFFPSGNILFDYIQAERATLFGTSAKYIDACANAELDPASDHDFPHLRTIASTGSPLVPEGFDYAYQHIKSDVCLSSIAGGTDIVGCFMGGNPIGPVWRGEIQARHLAMAVEVFNDQGQPVRGEKGELVCVKPFPSMPVGFWDDRDGARYRAAYFETYPNI
ncbi:MAG: acetoacetate--CoA ligase, partial [Kiloniellales bacterium]|nr:acetoacetate--CoA ligase [Kiloniellales bacterium]